MTEPVQCPISGTPMPPVFSEMILGKHRATYYYCQECGLLKTEKPYWLDEAYQHPLSDYDTGVVARNILHVNLLGIILDCLGIANGRFVDVAGGCGLLTRLMRDKGFDCYTTDKYCPNVFAKCFEPGPDFKADALFAFEVMEHVEDPVQFVSGLFRQYACRTLIFSTWTFADAIPSKEWRYYSFETGQHITFYQPRTLSRLADGVGSRYYMIQPGLHLITDLEISRIARIVFSNKFIRRLYFHYVQRKRRGLSKAVEDQLKIREHLKPSPPCAPTDAAGSPR
jgi:hypothetical protein